ncbi:hypothetical protein [Pelagerythrobacter rhizovicinus]|uniref:Tetratricopeptide repeat protein n=1 Tax=Pelagerythrobacter rhizovicinus TaxID=2268576 RepID=A0A4Q2KKL5_9SPHN|nr:hypothetical protein [Pelagerythrobacter rhizovicinus]RXZ65824.1 hypothetical protein ETX26_03595 [Pelagerythrobacter rhizovicinus]
MRIHLLAIAALAFAAPAGAEVLEISWGRAAPAAEVASMHGLAVAEFGGTDGARLAAEIERRLAEARDARGRPYYELFALNASGAVGNVEAVIEGNASVNVEERRTQQRRRYCKDSDKPRTDCDNKDKNERQVTCRTRIVSLAGDMRIARESDGRVIYRRSVPKHEEATWCPGDAAPGSSEEAVDRLIAAAAGDYASDLRPHWQRGQIRVLESRKGLSDEQGEGFKAALRATKSSGEAACRIFEQLVLEAPAQRSLMFNTALCAEMRGDYGAALAGFRAMGGDAQAAAAAERVRATLEAIAAEEERG